jgi:oxalate decarboxylase
MSNRPDEGALIQSPARRSFVGMGSAAAIDSAALAGFAAKAQDRANINKGEHDHSASDPGQENQLLLKENPSSNMPPKTDSGDVGPI